MNEIIKSLYDRKSVRVFEDRPIPADMKKTILETAAQAPSAGCQQLYTIIDVKDQAIKDALADFCDHQPFIAKADMVEVFCADCKKWYDAYIEAGCNPRHPGVGDLMLAVTDATIAAQNTVVAAEGLGIGSCYIGDIMENQKDVAKLLHLPGLCVPGCHVGLRMADRPAKDAQETGTLPTGNILCMKTHITVWMGQNCVVCWLTTASKDLLKIGAQHSASANTIQNFLRK